MSGSDPASGRFDVGCEKTVGRVMRYFAADVRMHVLEHGGGARRSMKVDALRGREQFDAHHAGGVVDHGPEAARRVSGHADVILLVRRGWYGVHAAGKGHRLVLGNESRGG